MVKREEGRERGYGVLNRNRENPVGSRFFIGLRARSGGKKNTLLLFMFKMSDDETFDWGIDDVATHPEDFYVDKILEVDAETFEEIGMVRVSIGRESDHSGQILPTPKLVLIRIADGETELKDYLVKRKMAGMEGM